MKTELKRDNVTGRKDKSKRVFTKTKTDTTILINDKLTVKAVSVIELKISSIVISIILFGFADAKTLVYNIHFLLAAAKVVIIGSGETEK